jgi:drug/metabolite transporter (DMT)-like permease
MATMNSAVRHMAQEMHPFEIVFFRNLFAFVFLLPPLMRYGAGVLRTKRFGGHLGRAVLNVATMMVFFTAVSMAPLSDVVALGFAAPVFATVLSILILGEVVGARRWTAIACGFIGALIVLQPGFDEIVAGQVLALSSAVMWAGCLLIIKSLSRTDSSLTIVAYMCLLMTPMALVPALFVWQWPDWEQLGWLGLIGLCGVAGQFLLAQALHDADLSVVMPLDFSKLIWVSVIAYFAFGEVPEIWTWIGGAMILASAAYIARRESRPRAAPEATVL